MNVFELVAKIGLDSSEYEKGLADAGNQTKSVSSKLRSTIGIASAAGVAAFTAITAAAVKTVTKTAEYGDQIDKASQKLGISSKAYQEWDAVLQHSGTSMGAMSSSFKTLANAAQDASADQAAAFERIGLSMQDVASMSTEELWSATIAGLQKLEDGTERTAIATDLLGKGAMELGPLFNTSAEDTQKMIDRVNELGGVMSDEAVKNAAQFQDNLQDLKTMVSGVGTALGNTLIPHANKAMEFILNNSGKIMDFTNNVLGGIERGIDSISNAVSTVIGWFESFYSHVESMGNGSFLQGFGNAFMQGQEMMNGTWVPPGFADGLGFVPYDNFPARLHYGEQVLTREEAAAYRNGGGGNFPGTIVVQSVLDGRVIGETAYDFMNRLERSWG